MEKIPLDITQKIKTFEIIRDIVYKSNKDGIKLSILSKLIKIDPKEFKDILNQMIKAEEIKILPVFGKLPLV